MAEEKVVRWGILGAGKIARRFARSLTHVEGARLVALSCRSARKAETFAREFGLAEGGVYCDESLGEEGAAHQALLADPTVDAIYLALPHALHHDWAVRALRAGKAVLCEKPACLTAGEVADLVRVADETGSLFMEAMKARFTPCYRAVREAVEAGEIGRVVRVETSLCNDMADLVASGTTYHSQSVGGGVLLDCGIYCASWIEDFLPAVAGVQGAADEPDAVGVSGAPGAEGVRVTSFAGVTGEGGLDLYVDAQLVVGAGTASLECAFDRAKPRQAVLVGTRGRILVEDLHRCQRATVFSDGREPRAIDAPYQVDDFYGEAWHFTRLVAEGARQSQIMPLAASVRCARIVDAIKARCLPGADALRTIEAQEAALRWKGSFTSADALRLGCVAARLARGFDRGVTVRVVREPDGLVMFEWASDDKAPRNQVFAEGKRQASLAVGHASLWAFVAHELDGSCQDLFDRGTPERMGEADFACPVAGALPIRDREGRLLATLCVSGLHEGRDHELAVRALAQAEGLRYGSDVPAYSFLAR